MEGKKLSGEEEAERPTSGYSLRSACCLSVWAMYSAVPLEDAW
jgi:hypothetical protein